MKNRWYYVRTALQSIWIITIISACVFVSNMMLKNKQDSGMGPLVIMTLLLSIIGEIEIAERFRKLEQNGKKDSN